MTLNACFSFAYPDFRLAVDVSIPATGVTAIFGPSGSGKTSFLRSIAGFCRPPRGRIDFCGDVWQNDRHFLPPHRRPVGYVFQEASLFDHLDVQGNLTYGLVRARKPLSAPARQHILDLLGITGLEHRMPFQLSGGERQRVAIARALLPGPALLLMDEPLSALDMARKSEILGLLERLKAELSMPLLYVSHNVDEVTRLADHLILLEQGQVKAHGPIATMLSAHHFSNRPNDTPFSLLFGEIKTVCTPHQLMEVTVGDVVLRLPQKPEPAPFMTAGQAIRLHLYARDVSIALTHPQDTSILNIFASTIERIDPPDPAGQQLVHLCRGDIRIQACLSAYSCDDLGLKAAMNVYAQIKAVSLVD